MSDIRKRFVREHPDFPLLANEEAAAGGDIDRGAVDSLLRSLGWLFADERVRSCSQAGAGNMNLTLRVVTDRRSLILKQSRPWVEKYDFIAAPFDRALIEAEFYRRTGKIPAVRNAMPRLLGADSPSRTLLLEDLGEAADLSALYSGATITGREIAALGAFLRALHGGCRGQDPGVLENREMRALNGAHIFEIPLDPGNGLELEQHEPGLLEAARALQADTEFRRRCHELARRYFADGTALLHGDFFPGSWLRTAAGLRVIDPEFCFFGDPEFDYGVAIAHFVLARQAVGSARALLDARLGEQPEPRESEPGKPRAEELDEALVARYAAIEITRRLIGVAQLPIPPSEQLGQPDFRAGLLGRARLAMIDGNLEVLGV